MRDSVPIIGPVTRRVHVPRLQAGRLTLDDAQAHHLRAVLRLSAGQAIEVFDDAGSVGEGTIVELSPGSAIIDVSVIGRPAQSHALTVAAAIPKGNRADWMVEKLSELGVAEWIPLLTERSVVLAEGKGKPARWERIAVEAARQSRRQGVLKIHAPTSLAEALAIHSVGVRLVLATAAGVRPISAIPPADAPTTVFIGPEGGWTADELAAMAAAGLTAVSLGPTILRVETAAVVAAGIIMAMAVAFPGNTSV